MGQYLILAELRVAGWTERVVKRDVCEVVGVGQVGERVGDGGESDDAVGGLDGRHDEVGRWSGWVGVGKKFRVLVSDEVVVVAFGAFGDAELKVAEWVGWGEVVCWVERQKEADRNRSSSF